MNGALNVFAALVLGGAIIAGGWIFSRNQEAEALTPLQLAEFKEEYIKEAQESAVASCDAQLAEASANCQAEIGRLGALEQPYTSGIAVSDIDKKASDGPQVDTGRTATSSETYVADRKTAVLGASLGGDDSGAQAVDKPDSNQYFTENRRLRDTEGPNPIDKPDSNQFFTENRTIDGKPIDKPDSSDYFTEYKPLKDPCVRDDGTVYTGPGTADDPFAVGDPCLSVQQYADPCTYADGTPYTGPGTASDPNALGNPCLVEQQFAYKPPDFDDPCKEGRMLPQINEFLQETDPCVTEVTEIPDRVVDVPQVGIPPVITPDTPAQPPVVAQLPPAWTSPYQTYGPEFPRTTLGPRGSDYPVQMSMLNY